MIAPELLGLSRAERRPVKLAVPESPCGPMAAWVHHLLRWAFDPDQVLARQVWPVLFE